MNCVFLPGLDGTGDLLGSVLRELPAEIQAKVIAYPKDEILDLTQLADYVVKRLPPEKTVLVAESFSGLVAMTFLPDVSSRFLGVIFVGAFAEPPRPMVLRLAPIFSRSFALVRAIPSFFLRQFCLGPGATADDIRQLRGAIASVRPEVLGQRIALVAKRHSFKKLPRELPSCYVRAAQDRLVPAACAAWFLKQFKNCRLEEIAGPHFLMTARPKESASAISSQIRRMTGT